MRRILDDNGIKYVELEFLYDWFLDDERRKRSDEQRRLLLTAAEALGARHIKVGDFFREECPTPRLIEEFAQLCRDADEHGTKIVYEMMPFSRIDSLEASRELVEGASARNGGVIFDLWHIVKLGIPYDSVARFPKQYFYGVEINDGYLKSPPGMDFREETTGHRKLCGHGRIRHQGLRKSTGEFALSRPNRHRGPLERAAQLAARQDSNHRVPHDARAVQLGRAH